MKQWENAHWIVLVQEGDTPQKIAAWMEENVTVDLLGTQQFETGEVDWQKWVVQPQPGDVLVFQTPPPQGTTRFGGYVQIAPVHPGDALMRELERLRVDHDDLLDRYSQLHEQYESLRLSAWNDRGNVDARRRTGLLPRWMRDALANGKLDIK